MVCPLGAYVYHVQNRTPAAGLSSNTKPWPEVPSANQLPEYAKSAFVGRADVVEHVTLGARRVSAIAPVRPSMNEYESVPLSHVVAVNVAMPTALLVVAGGASKLPPTLR